MKVEDVPATPPDGWVINQITTIKRNTGAVELHVFMQKPDPERKLPYQDWPMLRFDAKFDDEKDTTDQEFWEGVMSAVAEHDKTIITVLP